ncbi:MAG: signal recognition particle protein [Phycisphaeraceae bacterium]
MFGQLSERFESALRRLSGQSKLSAANVREAMDDVRTALLEADVHYDVVESFCSRVQTTALGSEVLDAVKPGEQMIKVVHDELVRLLGGDEAVTDTDQAPAPEAPPLMEVVPGPTIIMMAGLQGSGKTTTCGKLASYLRKRGKSVVLAAADLQRPAAVKQLEVLATQVQSEVEGEGEVSFYAEPDKVAEYGKAVGAAVSVCRNALTEARRREADFLILDTAGRLHVNDDLMAELRQVRDAVNPHQILLVIDAMTGQDAVNSAKAFNDQLEVDGVILSKYDSDTRGGAALSVRQVTGQPIKFVGVGEKLDALEAFHPTRVAGRILGMGDVVSLVERAQEQVSEEEAQALQDKMAKGQMTMDDFLGQLRAIRRMGSFKSLLGMLPGVGQAIKDLPIEEKQIDRTEAIIQSMTRDERKGLVALNNNRRRRIAKGSGTRAEDVSQLVKGFEMVSQMGKAMSGMGMLGKAKSMAGMNPEQAMAALGGPGGMPGRKGSTHTPSIKSKYKQRKKRR